MTNIDIVRKAQNEFLQAGRPDIKTGMEVEVHQIIKEGNKQRIQRFKGIVIKTAGKSELEKTITVRRKVGAFGVEKVFAIHSPTIDKIDVLRQFKVRRKSIKFIRELTGKAARLKEIKMDNATLNAEKALPTVTYREVKTEAPKTEPKVETPAEEVKVEETKTEDK
jgi:large subunit ribosomal protein L19